MYDFQNIGIAIKTSLQLYNGFLFILLIIISFSALGLRAFSKTKPMFFSLVLAVVVVIIITFSIGPDKYPYYIIYKKIALSGLPIDWFEKDDPGWRLLTFILSKLCFNEVGYFLIIAVFYVFANRYFCLKQTQYSNYLFVAVVSFMGFYAYGVNTIRAGVALSVLLIAMTKIENSRWIFILIAICAIFIHKSVAIPTIAILIAFYYDKPRIYIIIWGLCLGISLLLGDTVKGYIVQYLGEADDRIISYIGANRYAYYKVGFRWDFVAYSILPIIIGFYHILKGNIVDKAYRRLFNVYVMTNSFWLLVISVPFSDRFAYLSWFLYPYVLLLPYLEHGELPQIKKATMFIVCVGGFNVLMNL